MNPVRLYDVITVSDMCADMILTGNVRPQFRQVEQIIGDCSLELGGSANIFACQSSKLGANVAVAGWIGQDTFGDFALQQLQESGVDTTLIRTHPNLKTGIGFALSEPDDRAILTYMGTIDAMQPEHLNVQLLDLCRHWQIAAFFLLGKLRGFWLSWLKSCRQMGVTTSLDTNWDPQNRWDGVTELLPYVDIFLPNEAEALAITGMNDVHEATRCLSQYGGLVVVKRGEKGVIARRQEQTWELHPGNGNVLPRRIVDTTGAGDNFDAGFIRSWLAGQDIDYCLELGHSCAVSSLSEPGGIRGQLRDESIAAFLNGRGGSGQVEANAQ